MQDFHNLDTWKRAHSLVLAVHKATQAFSPEEVFGLTMQLRRGTVSIAARIAEGCGRDSNVAFANDLKRAAAACSEVEYYLLLAKDLSYLNDASEEQLTGMVIEVRKMIHGLLRKL